MTEQGKILRTPANEIRTIGRATQGVRLMDLEGEDKIVSVALVEAANGDDAPANGGTAPPADEPPPSTGETE
jgi:DNA gyrase subunit A